MTRAQLRTRILADEAHTEAICAALAVVDPSAVLLELGRASKLAEEEGLERDEMILERLHLSREIEEGARRKAIDTLLFYVVAGRAQDIVDAAELERTAHWLDTHGL